MSESAFSSIDLVGQCLLDQHRTNLFRQAIEKMVAPETIVLDAGTGSGVLAMLAAKAGAKEVYAIEKDHYIASVARENIKSNHLENIVKVKEEDMESLRLPTNKHIDLVIMEMLTTGMIDEAQVQAVNHLKTIPNVDGQTIFLPNEQESFITFGYSNFEIYNLKIPMILHLWDIHAKLNDHFSPISEKIMYDSYNFSTDNRPGVEKVIEVNANNSGNVNSILLESKSILNRELYLEETPALNGKVLIPIPEIKIRRGEILKGKLIYGYGQGFESLSFNW